MRVRQLCVFVMLVVVPLLAAAPTMAKNDRGFLIVHVTPPETYIFADGEPVVESERHYIILTPGEHEIEMYNYGYKPETRKVMIHAHKWWNIQVKMQPIPGRISGPWGCITIEGAPRAAVLLNGLDPAIYFVGHGDEFNNEWGWHQELIVPPGKQLLTLEYLETTPWTTTVNVEPNKRVVVDAYVGVRKTVPWPRGEQMTELPRFHAGFASAQVAVEKVKGDFSASTDKVNCGDSARLTWSTTGAGRVEIDGQSVGLSGDTTIQPRANTDYKFVASGPGGIITSEASMKVNNTIPATLSVNPASLSTGRSTDGSQQDTATVSWSAPNATNVTLDPLGKVDNSGNREVSVSPPRSGKGKTITYTLHATNSCGGAETRTATLYVPGTGINSAANQNPPDFISVYFPTDWPTVRKPLDGLVPSQHERVIGNASDFKQYVGDNGDAKLILEAHADERGTDAYNQALSERRAENVKQMLVDQGIPADKIEVRAYGKTNNLTAEQVEKLVEQDPNATPQERRHVAGHLKVFQWANNRRVDIRLSSNGEVSERYYPLNTKDMSVLVGIQKPSPRESASLR